MEYFERHKLIALTLAIQIIALPLLLILTRQQQEPRGHALTSTSLFFSPQTSTTNPKTLNIGEYFSIDIVLEPGEFLISGAQIEVFYDPTKVALVEKTPILINSSVFPKSQVTESQKPGKIDLDVNISDPTKPVSLQTKIATLYFKALGPVERSFIYFGDNMKLIKIDGTNSFLSGNPEAIMIGSPSGEIKSQTTTFPKLKSTKR